MKIEDLLEKDKERLAQIQELSSRLLDKYYDSECSFFSIIKEAVRWADENPSYRNKPTLTVRSLPISPEKMLEELNKPRPIIAMEKPRWIRVDAMLPDSGVEVFVAYKWLLGEICYGTATYNKDSGWDDYDDIIAWMPIPKF